MSSRIVELSNCRTTLYSFLACTSQQKHLFAFVDVTVGHLVPAPKMASPIDFIFFVFHRILLLSIHLYMIIKQWWRRSTDCISLSQLIQLKDDGHFNRLPKHLAFIANSQDTRCISLDNLAKFVCWSVFLRIPYISLHEPNGQWKSDQDHICELIQSTLLREGVPESELTVRPG
jgi:hypothetical protein